MHPILFEFGPFRLYSFGLMVVLGFMAGATLSSRLAQRRGLPGEVFFDAAVVLLFSGIAGARLLFVLLNWKSFAGHLGDVTAIWQGGMSFHGGAAAGILSGAAYLRWKKIPVLAMADAAGPGLALGYAIGRIGCLLNGCCYGVPTDLPWGMPFREGQAGVHYHPVQLYATALNLVLCAALFYAYRRPHRTGQVLALYLAGYSIYRFAVESLRKGVTAEVFAFGLTDTQAFSILLILLAGLGWVWLQRHGSPAPEADPAAEPAPAAPASSTA